MYNLDFLTDCFFVNVRKGLASLVGSMYDTLTIALLLQKNISLLESPAPSLPCPTSKRHLSRPPPQLPGASPEAGSEPPPSVVAEARATT